MDKKMTFNNRATVKDGKHINCDKCYEHTVFFLKDNYHEFSIGMSTILECVMFAIRKGDLPKLPDSWLGKIDDLYRTNYANDTDLSYHDYHKK